MRTARWQDSPKAFLELRATVYQGAISRTDFVFRYSPYPWLRVVVMKAFPLPERDQTGRT